MNTAGSGVVQLCAALVADCSKDTKGKNHRLGGLDDLNAGHVLAPQ
jgi:hypothetical protein